MKKLLAFLLILVCFSSLTACKEDSLDNVNTDSNNSSNQEQVELQQIPIQSFDGVWKETSKSLFKGYHEYFEIIIENDTIKINCIDFSGCNNVTVFDGVWKNPSEEVTEYSYNSKMYTGYYVDDNGNRIDYYDLEATFVYKNGNLTFVQDSSIVGAHRNYSNGQIIYFEKISD